MSITIEAAEAHFRAGEACATGDEENGSITVCPFVADTPERHWWMRGYGYKWRSVRAQKAEAALGQSRVEKSELRVRIAELLCAVAQYGNEANWLINREHPTPMWIWLGDNATELARCAVRHDADCNEFGAPTGDSPSAIANNAARAITKAIEKQTGQELRIELCVAIAQVVMAAIEKGKQ